MTTGMEKVWSALEEVLGKERVRLEEEGRWWYRCVGVWFGGGVFEPAGFGLWVENEDNDERCSMLM